MHAKFDNYYSQLCGLDLGGQDDLLPPLAERAAWTEQVWTDLAVTGRLPELIITGYAAQKHMAY
jgi:hypothetical protein